MSKTKDKEAARQDAREYLLGFISPGTDIYTVSVNPAFTQHRVFVIVATENSDGKPFLRDITGMVARAAGFRVATSGAIQQGGGGYSKSFQIVYSLGCALWPNGTPEPHGKRNGEPDSAGGYALNHRQMLG